MKTFTGINIQFPISRLILEGKKNVETRTYPLPKKYENVELLFVETPGRSKSFKSQIVAKIIFGKSFEYKSKKEFYADYKNHLVDSSSMWAWKGNKSKWGWPIVSIAIIKKPVQPNKRLGIKFTKNIIY